MNKKKIILFILPVFASFLVASDAVAGTLCQRKNSKHTFNANTRFQAIIFKSKGSCPSGWRAVASLPSATEIDDAVAKHLKVNAASLIGPQGPEGAQGPSGQAGSQGPRGEAAITSRPGDAPLIVSLPETSRSTYSCIAADVRTICGDEDGCRIRLLTFDTAFSVVAPFESFLQIAPPASAETSPAPLSAAVLINDTNYPATLGGSQRYTLWSPVINSIAVLNYVHGACPEQNGVDGAPFSGVDRYNLLFLAAGRYKVTAIIYDN